MARRLTALFEVLGVYVAGPLVATWVGRLLHLTTHNPLEHLTTDITNSELVDAARQMFVLLTLQYVGYFILIVPVNWMHRRTGPIQYGLTTAGRRPWNFFTIGAAAVAVTTVLIWPISALLVADALCHLHLGGTVPWREAFFDMSWQRWQFWLFSAVMSWALIPVLEELFFRGYCQRRLAEDWGDGPAVLGAAFLFTFTHGQYLTLNAYNMLTIAYLLTLAMCFGTVFAWTRSLYPAMVAHAIIDVPLTPGWQTLVLVALTIGGLFMFKRGIAAVRKVFANMPTAAALALVLIGAAWAVVSQEFEALIYAAMAMLVAAIVMEAVDRRRPPSAATR